MKIKVFPSALKSGMWVACIVGEEAFEGVGKNEKEEIGALVKTHPHRFGVEMLSDFA
ncbi:MAG: hypothetical protein NT001_05025 [Candidatus Woesearchaeota archaeon]|nr:hypothetical protein [Candidatus Woesearchaeota archaeon]